MGRAYDYGAERRKEIVVGLAVTDEDNGRGATGVGQSYHCVSKRQGEHERAEMAKKQIGQRAALAPHGNVHVDNFGRCEKGIGRDRKFDYNTCFTVLPRKVHE